MVDYTTQQYFERKRSELFPGAQINIARACLRYLSLNRFGNDKGREMAQSNANLLFPYAACYWVYHAKGEAEKACKEAALCLLRKVANTASAISVFRHHTRYDTPRWIPEGFSEVHLLAFFGLEITMCNHLESSTEADSKSKGEHTPLSYMGMRVLLSCFWQGLKSRLTQRMKMSVRRCHMLLKMGMRAS